MSYINTPLKKEDKEKEYAEWERRKKEEPHLVKEKSGEPLWEY